MPHKKQFLIICEGQTEELYFRSFPVQLAEVVSVSEGRSKTTLVERVANYFWKDAKEEERAKEKEREEGIPINKYYRNEVEVWCVFDLDNSDGNEQTDFNNAIRMAYEKGYKCAYSNDAFELWFVLHYQYIDLRQPRSFYFKTLSKHWGISYRKEGKKREFATTIYNRLKNDTDASQQKAIRHARRLHHEQLGKDYHQQNPVTTVYLLVEELNKYIEG